MALHGPATALDDDVARAVLDLAERAGRHVGHTPLGDNGWSDLIGGCTRNFAAAWAADEGAQSAGTSTRLDAYVQLVRSAADPTWIAEVLVDPAQQGSLADIGAPLLSRALRAAAELGGGPVHLWAANATPGHAELAARAGLSPHRGLHQMERPLPLDEPYDLPLRAFVPGQDEDAVVEVNRVAFANHPEQGQMTRAMLEEREAQSWFDPAGFLLTELEGRLAGFCWTKLFAEEDPVLGEIHVIGIHPDFEGKGLGRGLVLAGLDHLAKAGATVGMLFVEADNQSALKLYDRLGFHIVRTDRSFAIELQPG
jgi:mycothiol synthase